MDIVWFVFESIDRYLYFHFELLFLYSVLIKLDTSFVEDALSY